ncbi:MAG: hypothetical protein QM770_16920 [Tepidisphaeraceae bacterium]
MGDTTTPWWFPSETRGGLIDAQRIVLPIPPGMRWNDEMPVVLPQEAVGGEQWAVGRRDTTQKEATALPAAPRLSAAGRAESRRKKPAQEEPQEAATVQIGRMQSFAAPAPAPAEQKTKAKPPRVKKAFAPEVVAQVREVRDRWSEQQEAFVPASDAKYDVGRIAEPTQRWLTTQHDEPSPDLLAA